MSEMGNDALIHRLWPAIAALQDYGQKTGAIRLGAPLAPIVVTVLKALREPTSGMVKAGMAHEATDLATEFTAMIDHLLKEE